MAELQAAQQDALATFDERAGLTPGSSTPPGTPQRLPVHPINFIQTDNSPPGARMPALPGSILARGPGDRLSENCRLHRQRRRR